MPDAPKRFRAGKVAGPAPPRDQHNWRPKGTRQQRGYDQDWLDLREAYIELHPACERCEEQGIVTETEQVHHRKAFKGLHDPLRLDWDNLVSVCRDCHRVMERERKRG